MEYQRHMTNELYKELMTMLGMPPLYLSWCTHLRLGGTRKYQAYLHTKDVD